MPENQVIALEHLEKGNVIAGTMYDVLLGGWVSTSKTNPDAGGVITNKANVMNKIEFAVNNGFNLLQIGVHGVGKTKGVLAKWQEMGYTDDITVEDKIYAYLNCPVLDVYEDLRGLPINKDGEMIYIKPSHRAWEKVELLFLDEPNRAHPKVVNTLYELIQLKSINGIKLPKLRSVFAAMNPHGEDYSVEVCDNSFFDRFQMKIMVQPELNQDFFVKVKGLTVHKFGQVKDWWQAIPEEIRLKEVSPRRVEFCVDVANVGGDLEDVIPSVANPSTLQSILTGVVKAETSNRVMDLDKLKKFLDNYKEPEYQMNFIENLRLVPKELLSSHFPYNNGSLAQKLDSEKKVRDFIWWIACSNLLESAMPCFDSCPTILVTIIKEYKYQLSIRQKAYDLLTKTAPALAKHFQRPTA